MKLNKRNWFFIDLHLFDQTIVNNQLQSTKIHWMVMVPREE